MEKGVHALFFFFKIMPVINHVRIEIKEFFSLGSAKDGISQAIP